MADIPVYPLYNRTYLLYRVSPLHTNDHPLLQESVLRTHQQRLQSQLKGDSIRGVEVDYGHQEGALARLGPLERCIWDLMGDEDDWINRHRHLVDPDASQLSGSMPNEQARGVHVSLEYESTTYTAMLLRDPGATRSPEGFTSLPLLMVKMPAPVRAVFLHYLETAFDAHVAPLQLSSSFLSSTLETYFRYLTAPTSTQSIREVVRQLQLKLSFPGATTQLRDLDITIPSSDVEGFVQRGKMLDKTEKASFTGALSTYLQKHLALNLNHPKVLLSQISCASLTLGTDRLKLAVPQASEVSMIDDVHSTPGASPSQLALADLYASLVREATGTGRFLISEDSVITDGASSPPATRGTNQAGNGNGAARKRAPSAAVSTAKKMKAKG